MLLNASTGSSKEYGIFRRVLTLNFNFNFEFEFKQIQLIVADKRDVEGKGRRYFYFR